MGLRRGGRGGGGVSGMYLAGFLAFELRGEVVQKGLQRLRTCQLVHLHPPRPLPVQYHTPCSSLIHHRSWLMLPGDSASHKIDGTLSAVDSNSSLVTNAQVQKAEEGGRGIPARA